MTLRQGDAVDVDLDELARRSGLGLPRNAFYPTRRKTWDEQTVGERVALVVVMALPLGLLGVITLAFLLSSAWIVGVLLLAFATVLFSRKYTQSKKNAADGRGRSLRLYEHGVMLANSREGSAKIYRWADMTVLQQITRHYRNGAHTHTTYAYTLSGPDAPATRVNGGVIGTYADPDTWGAAIQEGVTAAQLPSAMAAVSNGGSLEFGGFRVDLDSLSSGNKTLPWAEVQELKVKDGYLTVRRDGRWFSFSSRAVSSIPNFFVFLAVANRLTGLARRE